MLISNIKELESTYTTIIGQVKELRDGWEETKRIYRFEWSRKAEDLAQKVKSYAPENWDPKVHVSTLVKDAHELIRRAKQNTPDDTHAQIIESGIPNLLNETKKIIDDIINYEQNQVQIEVTNDFIVAEEQKSKIFLKITCPGFHKIVKEVNKWDLSTEWIKIFTKMEMKEKNYKRSCVTAI